MMHIYFILLFFTLLSDRTRESGSHTSAVTDSHQNAVEPPPADENSHGPSVR